ncbi:lipopolysaccharide biosynthesis protein [Granulicella sp. L46]|jgi:O-antigen/teichoic acid export membrane protein|uniref:lipopolysaccharide biosynthesis protein n=1 Tax=Granulicella sp. L46 TaxID=1641865 RepID=UPI00131D00A2|nr:oligosaccharide flippase family protein [Granulicella sp. L46]
MKRHLTNAVYGVLDYTSYPFGMLMAAPVILHKLGAAEYGLWMIATAVVSAGGIIASGFCDVNIQRVARLRSNGEIPAVVQTVRSMMGINLVLGFTIALAVWIAAPFAARHIAVSSLTPVRECLICVRMAGGMILVRAVESVGVSTHRAFERYRGTVQISAALRLLTLASAAILALVGCRTVSILMATAVFLAVGTYFQFRGLRTLLGPVVLWPTFHLREAKALVGLGVFPWLQTLGGVVFGQFDRILLGVSLGALAVAPYALCVQFAQPVFGLTASGLHFLFPYLSGRVGTLPNAALKRTLLKAFVVNALLVASGAGLLILCGNRLIRLWAGSAVANSAKEIFVPIVLGSALMGLSVTGTYAMQALGLFRTVAVVSLGGRAAMLPVMIYLLHHAGLRGLAAARVCYGLIALIVYLPLVRELGNTRKGMSSAWAMAAPGDLQEGSQP